MNPRLATCLLALLLFSPASSVPAEEREAIRGPAAEYYPTRVGTRWVMRWTYVDGSPPSEDVIGVTEERIVNGYRKWKVRIVGREVTTNPLVGIVKALVNPAPEADVFDAWEFYSIDREAYVSRSDLEEGDFPITLLWWPAKAGDSFTDPDGITTTVVAEGRQVKVPAGTFECIVFETDYSGNAASGTIAHQDDEDDDDPGDLDPEDDPDALEDDEAFDPIVVIEYWAPGVGLVQTEEYLVDEEGKRVLDARQQLVSFHVPGVTPPLPQAVAPPRPE